MQKYWYHSFLILFNLLTVVKCLVINYFCYWPKLIKRCIIVFAEFITSTFTWNDLDAEIISAISSTTFTFGDTAGCSFRDNGDGKLQIVQDSTSGLAIISQEVGSVNYETGTVKIDSFKTSGYIGSAIKVFANPVSRTIISDKNIILSYNSTPTVTVTQERS